MATRDDLDVALLAAMVGGQLEQVDQLTVEAVNKSEMNRSGGKSNRLDPRKFIPVKPQQPMPLTPQPQDPNKIVDQISFTQIPDDLKERAKKYMQPEPQQTQVLTPMVPVPVQTPVPVQQLPTNLFTMLLEMDKKLDTIKETLELICKTAKIVRK